MSGAYNSLATRIEIRGTPAAKFGNFLKILTSPSPLFKWYENRGIDEENKNMQSGRSLVLNDNFEEYYKFIFITAYKTLNSQVILQPFYIFN
jgi:hypothetical protein